MPGQDVTMASIGINWPRPAVSQPLSFPEIASMHRCIALAFVLVLPRSAVRAQTPEVGKVDFARDVQPIFKANCVTCHGPDKQRGGLRLDTKAALQGGDSGVVIVP